MNKLGKQRWTRELKWVMAACIFSLSWHSHAQQLTGALKKIKETGTLTIGVRDSSIPFSYIDEKQAYLGYSVDLCKHVGSEIQKRLGMPSLKIDMVPVSAATRIPLVANSTVDMSCDSATNTVDRQKQVAFAMTEFISATRYVSRKDANIRSVEDLRGKTVVGTSGSSNLKVLVTLNQERKLGMNILTARDHAESFLMMESGRAMAFFCDDVLLASLAASSRSPSSYVVSAEEFSVEPYALILPKGDEAFKKMVDDSLVALFKSPDISRLYAKWFQSPIPPKGINLNLPMSASLKRVLAQPIDSPDPAAYKQSN